MYLVAFFGYAVLVLCVSHPFSLTSTKTDKAGHKYLVKVDGGQEVYVPRALLVAAGALWAR